MYLVLAYGNPLRRDDGVGWRTAERLSGRLGTSDPAWASLAGVEIRMVHQLTPELSQDVAETKGVVFLDARADGIPGEVRVSSVEACAPSSFAHSVSPGMLIALGQHLFGRSPRAALVTVTGESFELGEGLSPLVELAVEAAASQVLTVLQSWERSSGDH